MLDLPPQDINTMNETPSHFEKFIAQAGDTSTTALETKPSLTEEVLFESAEKLTAPETKPSLTEEVLFERAEMLKEIFADGFQWKDLGRIAGQTLDFVTTYQTHSADEIKLAVMTVLSRLIDITDTPYLPDNFTDPVFKSMLPPFIDLIEGTFEDMFVKLPTADSKKPTPEALEEYVKKMKETYADGFNWTDLMATIRHTIEFMGSFPYMDKVEKEATVVDLINHIIDVTDTPKVPDMFADNIFKAIVPSFVSEIFQRLP